MSLYRTIALGVFALSFATIASATQVSITVDDLPYHGDDIPGVDRKKVAETFLNTFKKYKLKNVYGFVIGTKLKWRPDTLEILKLWLKSGHVLGNHTYSHL